MTQNTIRQLESSLFPLNQIDFCPSQEGENDFGMPGNDLEHRFLDLIQIAFSYVQEPEN